MSTRAIRPKPVDISTEEEWIWGNNRGGGGAPLKDIGGTPVPNLRNVLKGNAEVDYSPSKSPIRHQGKHHSRDLSPEEDDRRDIRHRRDHGHHRSGRSRDRSSPERSRVNSPDQIRGLEDHYSAGKHGNSRGIKNMHGDNPEKEQRIRWVQVTTGCIARV